MKVPLKAGAASGPPAEVEVLQVEGLERARRPVLELQDPKEMTRVVKSVERLLRQSVEYRRYVDYLKAELDLTRCTFLSEVDVREVKGVGLEFHHYPFTLYDICQAAVRSQLDVLGRLGERDFSSLLAAQEVAELHYRNEVGLVPLSVTLHELAHGGHVLIPLDCVFGDVRSFLGRYRRHIQPELLEQLDRLVRLTAEAGRGYTPEILRQRLQELEVEGFGDISRVLAPLVAAA
jgi:hypothetical protein